MCVCVCVYVCVCMCVLCVCVCVVSGLPALATGSTAFDILHRVARLSLPFYTNITVKAFGAVVNGRYYDTAIGIIQLYEDDDGSIS